MHPIKFIVRKAIFFLGTVLIFFTSCRREISAPNQPEAYVGGNFEQVFDAFWNGMNNNYVFWDIDTTNWDAVYSRYRPLFSSLNINDSNDVRKSVGYFHDMTKGLIDGHFTLTFTDSQLVSATIDPAYERIQKRNDFHSPFFYAPIVAGRYLDSNFIFGYDSTTSPGDLRFALTGTINRNVAYLTFSEFSLKSSFESANSNGIKPVLSYFFNLIRSPNSLKGIIIDVRLNGGGDIADLNFLVGKFITTPLKFGYTRYKSGNGRLDRTPWADAIVSPQPNAVSIVIPVIVLADMYSVSMAELTTMAIHTLPNGKFIGETTWGANGPLSPNEFFNAGQFVAAGFVNVYTSSSEFKYLDNNIYEGKGFPPDIAVPFDPAALESGDDPALDKAISQIP